MSGYGRYPRDCSNTRCDGRRSTRSRLPESYFAESCAACNSVQTADIFPITFSDQIVPIFQAKCSACHGEKKQEGEFRVDVIDDLVEGGESGRPAVSPGDMSASYLIELLTLPRSHEDVMPPRDAPPLTREEMRVILHWMYEGAPGLEPEDESLP